MNFWQAVSTATAVVLAYDTPSTHFCFWRQSWPFAQNSKLQNTKQGSHSSVGSNSILGETHHVQIKQNTIRTDHATRTALWCLNPMKYIIEGSIEWYHRTPKSFNPNSFYHTMFCRAFQKNCKKNRNRNRNRNRNEFETKQTETVFHPRQQTHNHHDERSAEEQVNNTAVL